MPNFYDLDWGKESNDKVVKIQRQLARNDDALQNAVVSLMLAGTVTARGRKRSPSIILENLVNLQRRGNPTVKEHLNEAWNTMEEEHEVLSDQYDLLGEHINNKHRNRTGVSEALAYQLNVTYDACLDFWFVFADWMMGYRSVATQIFGMGDMTPTSDYLNRGITRSQMLASYGAELPEATDDDDDDDSDDTEESED